MRYALNTLYCVALLWVRVSCLVRGRLIVVHDDSRDDVATPIHYTHVRDNQTQTQSTNKHTTHILINIR